jgi:hypothetical protein
VDEDSVPTKLVWAMYDVGLVSTGGSGTSTKSADVYLAFTEHGVSSRLSDETRHKLIRYLEKYPGTQQRKVRKLRKTLDQTSQHGRSNSNSSVGVSGLPLSHTDVLKNTWGYILDRFKS